MTHDQSTDPDTLQRHFGSAGPLVPLWIAEPTVQAAPAVIEALAQRVAEGGYGYEIRPAAMIEAFRDWMMTRHAWDMTGLSTLVSPSVGTTIAVVMDLLTDVGDGVILQPPVFTDFKQLVAAGDRRVQRNPLLFAAGEYRIDLEDLEAKAAKTSTRMLILCNPHNPVGRVWSSRELDSVAAICARHGVFVLADEIHADLSLPSHVFVPFASVAAGHDVRWAAAHGPIKTFGLAGVCDTLLVTADDRLADEFEARSSQFHLTRNNVFGLAAFEAAYRHGGGWLDELRELMATNVEVLRQSLPKEVHLIDPEGTYLAWLDLRDLDIEVDRIPHWLGSAGVALSPGHWFGREGAGFARMTMAAPTSVIEQAAELLAAAVRRG